MKKLLLLLVFYCLSCMFLTTFGQYKIYGDLIYDNTNDDKMETSRIYLYDDSGLIDSVDTDGYGYYEFDNLIDGDYKVEFSGKTSISFGGITTTDATLIQQHFVGEITLTGIYEDAADVTGNNVVNSADAMEVYQRANHTISEYSGGKDWVIIATYVVTIDGGDEEQDIWTVCYGDVDGSYTW